MLNHGRPARGFSLIEVLAVLAMVAVLAAMALPTFERQVQQARRADAWVAAWRIQLAQERYRATAGSYGNLADIGVPTQTENGHYRLEMLTRDAQGFEVLASATGAQARDAVCRHLRLQWRELTPVYSSGPDRGLGNPPSANRQCWRQA